MKGVGKKRERDPDGLRNVLQGVLYKSLRSDVLLNVLKGMDGTLGMEYIEDKLRGKVAMAGVGVGCFPKRWRVSMRCARAEGGDTNRGGK